MSSMLKHGLRFDDLINKGARFEIEANREDDDLEQFDLIDEDIDEIPDVSIQKSPWQMDFATLRQQMIPLSNFLYKKIIKYGNVDIPNNSRIVIDYNAYFEHEEQSFDSTYMRGKPLKFRIGEGEVLEGLEQAVRTMKKGEESHFLISYNLLYGEMGCPPRIKPKADGLFIIRCKDFSELLPESIDVNTESSFNVAYKMASTFKEDAKKNFKKGNFTGAISKYKRAVEKLQSAQLKDETEEKWQMDMLKNLFLNLSVCYNKTEQPKKACTMINNLKDLGDINHNAKALYQESKALRMIGDYERARKCLRVAAKLAPDDDCIMQEMRVLEAKIQKSKDEEKKMCQNALGIISKKIAKVAVTEESQKDVATTKLFEKRIQEFMHGNVPTLSLPGPLEDNIVQCLKKFESVYNFTLEINETSSDTYYKLKKL